MTDLDFAICLADVADGITRSHFTAATIRHAVKPDGTPRTDADIAVEVALCDRIMTQYPQDGFLGEEINELGSGARRWIVDGIDGTRWFVAGEAIWATLIALEISGEIEIGVVSSPALKRRWWAARKKGAFAMDGGRPRRLHVSDTRELGSARAVLVPGQHELSGWRQRVAGAWVRTCNVETPRWHHWTAPLLSGKVDACVYLCGASWDHAAIVPIVEEAGGRFSDLWGTRRLDTGTAIFSNGHLHMRVLERLLEENLPPLDGAL
jgi:histidinol-phosphatase